MNKKMRFITSGVYVAMLIFVAFFNLSCQYDYRSPLPGVVEIRLKTISNEIEFDALNNFIIKITSINIIRSDGGKVVVYEDVTAIDTKTRIINTLDEHAQDSTLVIGATYAPPGDYAGVTLLIEPGTEVILRGYQIIRVETPETFKSSLEFPSSYRVEESRTTRIVLTIDLDKTLKKGAFTYTFDPVYYISSIQTF